MSSACVIQQQLFALYSCEDQHNSSNGNNPTPYLYCSYIVVTNKEASCEQNGLAAALSLRLANSQE